MYATWVEFQLVKTTEPVFQMERALVIQNSQDKHVQIVCKYYNIDKGCNSGGNFSCDDREICLQNGTCVCNLGYSGLTCSSCK